MNPRNMRILDVLMRLQELKEEEEMKRRVLALILGVVVLMMALPVSALSSEVEGSQPTNPPATKPPVTNPPATNPPATNPPATNPPATNPPATNPPATQAPTDAPTKAPATDAPTSAPTPSVSEGTSAEPTGAATENPPQDAEKTGAPAPEDTGGPEVTEGAEATPVPEAPKAALSIGVRSAFAGESVSVKLAVRGGAGERKVIYTVYANGAKKSSSDAKAISGSADTYTFKPKSHGDYKITATVTDEAGQTATASVALPVAEHDKTSYGKWLKRAKGAKLTGDWREDLIAVAETQMGYVESTRDFIIRDDGSKQGYTVYGDWYGMSYEEWCAMFVSFCAEYAGIPRSSLPREAAVAKMLSGMRSLGVYERRGKYEPVRGDIIFFTREGRPGHVGIVTDANESTVHTIEGNAGRAVSKRSYSLNESKIIGYANMRKLMISAGVATVEELYVPEAGDIAVIGDGTDKKFYSTVQKAIDAVGAGQTIRLLGVKELAKGSPKDATRQITRENIVSKGKSYTLDLNGWTIDGGKKGGVFKIDGGSVTLRNGTLTGGLLKGKNTAGGGLFVATSGEVELEGMIVTKNAAFSGAGIYLEKAASAAIIDSMILDNHTTARAAETNYGGGIYSKISGPLTLQGVEVRGNKGELGAALYVRGELKAFGHCEFSKNKGVGKTPSVLYFDGGDVELNGCEIKDNKDIHTTIHIMDGESVDFINCAVSGNATQKEDDVTQANAG